jgi:hypothetical protein
MSVTTAVPSVIDYLVTTFTVASTLGAATPPVLILDGPTPSEDYNKSVLWVGADDPDLAKVGAATGDQDWVGPGNRWRNEQLSILMVAQSWDGDKKVKVARDLAYATIAAAENILRQNANLGGNVLFLRPGSTRHRLVQSSNTNGAYARVTWRIDALARIGSSS